LAILAVAQAGAVYLLTLPVYYPRGATYPKFADGVAEARRLLHVTEATATPLVWREGSPHPGGKCEGGFFDGPNFVPTQIGTSYWITATAAGDERLLAGKRAVIESRWRKWYGDAGRLVENPGLTSTTASSHRREASYALTMEQHATSLEITIEVEGCYGPNLREVWK